MKLLRTYFRYTLILALLFCGYNSPAEQILLPDTAPADSIKARYDSSLIEIVRPDTLREQSVFEDTGLNLEPTQKVEDLNWFERFISWVLRGIFGDASAENTTTVTNVIIWIFVLAGLGFIIWILIRSEFSGFVKGRAQQSTFNFSDVEEDIGGINFEERIRLAVAESDYRLAIRWQYLKQLFLLNERQLISWQAYKTNIAYAHELSKTPLLAGFNHISRDYEYVWYGKYDITAAKYQELEQHFSAFEKGLNHV